MLNPDPLTPIAATPAGLAQRRRALEGANANRVKVAQLKRRMRADELSLADVILDPPPETRGKLLIDVLQWTPRLRRHDLRALNARSLRHGHLNLASALGELSEPQRRWLADQIAERR